MPGCCGEFFCSCKLRCVRFLVIWPMQPDLAPLDVRTSLPRAYLVLAGTGRGPLDEWHRFPAPRRLQTLRGFTKNALYCRTCASRDPCWKRYPVCCSKVCITSPRQGTAIAICELLLRAAVTLTKPGAIRSVRGPNSRSCSTLTTNCLLYGSLFPLTSPALEPALILSWSS